MKRSSLLKRFSFVLLVAGGLVSAAVRASATQITLPVTTSSSTLNVKVCAQPSGMSESCSQDTPNVSGYLVVSLDDYGTPTQISIRNYDLQATRDVNLHLSWVFGFATVDATATGLRLVHPTPGVQNSYYSVSGGGFTLGELPYKTYGSANYSANSVACAAFPAGQACSGTIDLSQNAAGAVSSVPGTVQINNGVVTVHLDFTLSQPLDAGNPSFGTMTVHGIINASGPVPSGLVPFGSVWHYLDNGSDQGTAWRGTGFDFSGWAFGEAQLGYGEGDEVTTNQFGPDSNNKYITTYYTCAFQAGNPASYSNLVLRLLRDDGAVVYLNNVEVFRSNMPTGAVNYLTHAAAGTTGVEENLYFAAYLSPTLLVSGRNVLSVEVHQESPTSSDVSFDLELQGNFAFSNQPPIVSIANPTNGAVLPSESFTLQAAASDPDGVIMRVEFFQDGVKIGEVTQAPYSVVIPTLCPGAYTFTARAWDNSVASTLSAPATLKLIRPTLALVPKGSDWKYLDNGTDPGSAWATNTFNDTLWAHGRAQLGYGDGDEVTTNQFGPDPNNRYITTYYRHPFVLTNMNSMLGLILRVLRDDGVVVYLNGTEIYRDNMPTGAVTYVTLASGTAGGSDETTNFHTAGLATNLLILGTNIIAAEIHQVTTNSSDISFDLELLAGYPNQAPLVLITNPVNEAEFPAGATILIQATAADLDGSLTRLEFFADAVRLGELFAPPYEIAWTNVPAGYHVLTARAHDDCGAQTDAAAVLVNVGTFSMVKTGAVWNYLDNGSNPGTSWRALGFNDAAWKTGYAEFGYGDDADGRPERTVVSYGSSSTNKYITTFFRRTWTVADKSVVTNLTVRLLRDDGAVVYLNGTEVFRSNMSNGVVNYLTLASNSISGAEETIYYESPVSPALLVNGTNVLAVEIHQVNATSTDISFDLELVANVRTAPAATEIVHNGGSYSLRWPSWAVGYRLYHADHLTPPINWVPVPAEPTNDGTWKTLTLPGSPTNGFYRVGW